MLILYVAMKYDYGRPEQGHSFEHYNFYDALVHMGHDILYFDFPSLLDKHGRDGMNRRLRDVAQSERADLLFCVLFREELDQDIVREVSETSATITFNWFCDDHWRFDGFSRHWAPCFNWVSTTDQSALPKYERIGYDRVIKTQWACNHFLYKQFDLPLKYDVTFIGKPHGDRRAIIQSLRDRGIDVQTWGDGWPRGRLSQEEMIRVFNQSRVNLNLSNASWNPRHKGLWRRLRYAIGRRFSARIREKLAVEAAKRSSDQIKGRTFEVPGCGGFLLTGVTKDLQDYYAADQEMACFSDTSDLITLVHYYLEHDDERQAIAQAGYDRTLREHTYLHRFTEIFRVMNVPCGPLPSRLDGTVKPGQTQEIT